MTNLTAAVLKLGKKLEARDALDTEIAQLQREIGTMNGVSHLPVKTTAKTSPVVAKRHRRLPYGDVQERVLSLFKSNPGPRTLKHVASATGLSYLRAMRGCHHLAVKGVLVHAGRGIYGLKDSGKVAS